jgi:nucleotide-binding universal stress UspA family protein
MTILVPYVPTSEGFTALGQGIDEARRRGSRIVVLNVVLNDNFAAVTSADEQQIDAVEARLTELGIDHEVRQSTDVDSVADQVLRAAEDLDAELIIVGLRRRSAVGKALLGSNAQQIILGAPCPVLSVRPS